MKTSTKVDLPEKGSLGSQNDLPGIVLINPKYINNLAAAVRAAACFSAAAVIWTGSRIGLEDFDETRIPRELRMREYQSVLRFHSDKPLNWFCPETVPVCVELVPGAESLTTFSHPKKAVYILGPEDGSVPQVMRKLCHRFVSIPSNYCLNLAATVNVVLYDRRAKCRL